MIKMEQKDDGGFRDVIIEENNEAYRRAAEEYRRMRRGLPTNPDDIVNEAETRYGIPWQPFAEYKKKRRRKNGKIHYTIGVCVDPAFCYFFFSVLSPR